MLVLPLANKAGFTTVVKKIFTSWCRAKIPIVTKIRINKVDAIFLFKEVIYPSRQVNAMKIGIRKSNSEKHVEVFSVALCSIIWKKIPSICGSKSLNAFTNKSCPNTKRIIENPNVQMYIFLEIFNLLAANSRLCGTFVQKVNSFWFGATKNYGRRCWYQNNNYCN